MARNIVTQFDPDKKIWSSTTKYRPVWGSLKSEKWKKEFSLWKRMKCFPSTLRLKNWNKKQSLVILDLCLSKTRSGKPHDYRDVITFENRRFQNVFRPHLNAKPAFSNSSGLKSAFVQRCFAWRISVDGWPNLRNKATFQFSLLYMWCGLRCVVSDFFWANIQLAGLLVTIKGHVRITVIQTFKIPELRKTFFLQCNYSNHGYPTRFSTNWNK